MVVAVVWARCREGTHVKGHGTGRQRLVSIYIGMVSPETWQFSLCDRLPFIYRQ